MTDSKVAVCNWKPTKEDLIDRVVVVIGAPESGKSVAVAALGGDPQRCLTLTGKKSGRIGYEDGIHTVRFDRFAQCGGGGGGAPVIVQTQWFMNIPPAARCEIDFVVLCGKQSKQTVERLWSDYGHLFDCSRLAFSEQVKIATDNWSRAVLDVSPPCRQGLRFAQVLWFRPPHEAVETVSSTAKSATCQLASYSEQLDARERDKQLPQETSDTQFAADAAAAAADL